MKKIWVLLALCCIVRTGDVLAWGAEGHRAVGAIADLLVRGSPAEQQLASLLLPGETLESVANWADCVKGSFCGAHTPEMTGFIEANPEHRTFHYTDAPFQSSHYYAGVVGSFDNDIVAILQQAISVLQGINAINPHHFTRRQALLLIVHLVGDLHQPLHVGNAFLDKHGQFRVPQSATQIVAVTLFSSNGGNSLLLDAATLQELNASAFADIVPSGGEATPATAAGSTRQSRPGTVRPIVLRHVAPTLAFHAYWDSTVVEYAMHQRRVHTPMQFAAIALQVGVPLSRDAGDPRTWPAQWADDTLDAAHMAYAGISSGKISYATDRQGNTHPQWTLSLPPSYVVLSTAVATTQLMKGGYRLARLLHAIWPSCLSDSTLLSKGEAPPYR